MRDLHDLQDWRTLTNSFDSKRILSTQNEFFRLKVLQKREEQVMAVGTLQVSVSKDPSLGVAVGGNIQ